MKKIIVAILILIAGSNAFSQQVAKGLTASNGQFVGFYQFTPLDYSQNPTKKYPVIIFLHGIGERGNGTTELNWITWHAIPRIIAAGGTMTYTNPLTGQKESFIVLSPQLSKSYGWWQNFYVDEMLKFARQNLRIDENRIYLTGLSAGGGGTWRYTNTSAANASTFAAIAPVCGTCDWNLNAMKDYVVPAKIGIWAFHAQDDYTVGVNCTNYVIDGYNGMNPWTPAIKTIYPSGGHYIWETVYTNPKLFEWFLSNSRSGTAPAPVQNAIPVAKAGNDVNITLPLSTITLSNAGSYDGDGTITSFRWSQVSGPSTAILATPTVGSTVASTLLAGTYVFRLTVTDNSGATAYDDIAVTVTAPLTPGQPPVADAGNDQALPVGQATVLHGETSSSPTGTIVKYAWTKVSGPAAYEMLTPAANATWVRNMTAGVYVFRLTVTDNYGTTAYDDVTLTVGSSTPTAPPPTSTTPVANAGKDESLPVGQATVLHGEQSTAPGSAIRSYQWTKYSGPAAYEMLTPTSSATWLRNMVAGVYVFRLTITDNNGATSYDDVTITVGGGTTAPPPPTAPSSVLVANAGKDETIPAGQATVLHGENSTVTGSTIKSYSWVKYSGPASYEILTPTSSASWIRKMTAGTYVYRLTVTDYNGNTATDDVTINVY
jgi:hypothetical protein